MKFTDLFIKRPVLAATVSLLILVLGLRAVTSLPIRQYPKTESATIVVQTVYFGADSQTMAGFITQPLEQAIAQAQGIDYMTSSSTPGVSLITVTLRLNYDGNRALTEISSLVNSVKSFGGKYSECGSSSSTIPLIAPSTSRARSTGST